MTNHWTDDLRRVGACSEAIVWAESFPDLGAAWSACDRGDWMLWLAGKCAGAPMSDSRRPLVLAACECARLTLYVLAGETRPLAAIELAERWASGGDITRDGLLTVADAAYAAYAYAAANAAEAAYAADNSASYAAADAAFAAYAAAYAAANAAEAAGAAANAAANAASYAATQCADIVRRHYPRPPVPPALCPCPEE